VAECLKKGTRIFSSGEKIRVPFFDEGSVLVDNNAPRQRRLRVAHVTFGLDVGGLEKLLVEFGRHADRERFDLHFVSLGHAGVVAEEIAAAGWPVTALGVPTGLHPSLAFRLARLLRRWGTDVVHTHDERPHLYGTLAGRLAGVGRIIHTRHSQGRNLSRRQRALVNLAASCVDRFVCVSQDSARLALRQGVPARKVCTVWNGIDLARFAYTGPRADGPAVIVARLDPAKDHATLLRATALAVGRDPSFRLEVAGDGPCREDLHRLTGELGLAGQVRFLGQVRDVPGLLARAGLFVLSSLSEGVSLTLLEAMAGGLPVVATRVGGNPEVVTGDTGLLVPAADPEALAGALLRLWQAPGERHRLGSAGRARVEGHFDVRRMVATYERLYRGSNTVYTSPSDRERQPVPSAPPRRL
jgi:glycosyltransferase involved in cell wall biosynthesis